MALITRFDDLPDLVLIELFSYLSSIDILWGFTRLNHHLTTLIIEKGFFRHINLSFVRYHQFNTILRFLPLNDIQSVSIDSYACPLQLTLWPYMPHDLKRIGSSSIFTDHRHIDVHFAFHLINCSEFLEMTQYIPRGNCFYPREIVGATFVVNDWSYRPDRIANDNHFGRGFPYCHHMWYTLPWTFDEFFHEYELKGWITKIQVFEQPQTMTTIYQSSLRTLDTSSENMTSSICSLPHVALSDCIETCNLFYYNTPFAIHLSALRNITLVNSINCLNDCSSFAATIRSIRIYIMYHASNYMLPDWPAVSYSLSTLQQLNSLGIFMYDLPKAVDTNNCQMIAEEALRVTNFALCFRRACCSSDEVKIAFKDNTKFIKQLCHSILRLSLNKHPYYSIEDDGCGLITWF
ncbi:unnamed protein product [Rotaria sordida]|uniref:F-box domain-containing protein n=1 Tax=Rotaria sordida TaxID=392033 RepID=A0A815RC90_9BILA|nr:unnamed protein product [Rotaria sordida]CAF4016040.1 unnamed protein product [Rotaria sordida]